MSEPLRNPVHADGAVPSELADNSLVQYAQSLSPGDRAALDAEFEAAARAAEDTEALAIAARVAEDLRLLVTEFAAKGDVEDLAELLANLRGLDGADEALALAHRRRAARP